MAVKYHTLQSIMVRGDGLRVCLRKGCCSLLHFIRQLGNSGQVHRKLSHI